VIQKPRLLRRVARTKTSKRYSEGSQGDKKNRFRRRRSGGLYCKSGRQKGHYYSESLNRKNDGGLRASPRDAGKAGNDKGKFSGRTGSLIGVVEGGDTNRRPAGALPLKKKSRRVKRGETNFLLCYRLL